MAHDITTAFIPQIQNPYINEKSTILSRLWRSGIVSSNSDLNTQVNSNAGNVYITPFNKSIRDAGQRPVVGSHTLSTKLAPQPLSDGVYQTQGTARAQSWNVSDLNQIIIGNDPVNALTSEVADYWVDEYQYNLISVTSGLLKDNVSNDSGDMIHSIYSDVASPAAGNLISADAVIDAQHTMGDHRGRLNAIMMHSSTRKQLEKDEPNNFIPASATNIGFDTYLGMVILEDDGMPVNADGATPTNTDAYDTYLFGADVFQYASDRRLRGEEWDRDITSGNGMGEDFLVTRRKYVMHPAGFDLSVTNPEDLVTDAIWEAGTNWDRKATSRKSIPIAVLRHNVL